MRSFSISAASALAAFSFFAVAGAVRAQTPATPPSAVAPSAPLAKPRTWLVENHDRLVSVREKNGPPLFAQVITTPNVMVEVSIPLKGKNTMTLKDATGKRLYRMDFPHVEHGNFGFEFFAKEADIDETGKAKTKSSGSSFTITPTNKAPEADESSKNDATLTLAIGEDNLLVNGTLTDGANRTILERQGLHFTATRFENGAKVGEKVFDLNIDTEKGTGTASMNGKEVSFQTGGETGSARVRDEKGEVAVRTVKQDGKDYTEFTVGDRKILVEGGNWHFELKEGVLTLTPTGNNASPATTTAANK